jgi:hypothetical protein
METDSGGGACCEATVPKGLSNLFRVIKCPLKKVIKDPRLIPIIEEYVSDLNQIVILGYQFIKAYLLHCYDIGKIPLVDANWILNVLKTICIKTNRGGTKCSQKSSTEHTEFQRFYDETFSKVIKMTRPISERKSLILKDLSEKMFVSLTTNIKTHFITYMNRYVNIVHCYPRKQLIHQERDKSKRVQMYQELSREIRLLKCDLIFNHEQGSEVSDPKYHPWIKAERAHLFPKEITVNVAYDVKCQPIQYLKHALYINRQIETLEYRPYQVIPQRTTYIPCHIPLNSSSIIEMLGPQPTKELLAITKSILRLKDHSPNPTRVPKLILYSELFLHAGRYHKKIWERILNLDDKLFKQTEYTFYHQLQTDGFSCSLTFIQKDQAMRRHGTRQMKDQDQDEEQEFQKVTDLTQSECEQYLSGNYKMISQDPGEIDPLSLIDDQDNFFQYSACLRRRETYTKRSAEILHREKEKNHIFELEQRYSGCPKKKKQKKSKKSRRKHKKSKKTEALGSVVASQTEEKPLSHRSTDPDMYQRFIVAKNQVSHQVKEFYQQILFRKLSFRRYVRTLQSETQLVKTIKHHYLERDDPRQILIFYGDHSRSEQMKGCIPCPNLGLKRLLANHFTILEVNEYLTSRVHHGLKQRMENLIVRRGNHHCQVHKILTLHNEETHSCIYVNRDYNACKNILNLGRYYLEHQERPKEFTRT